MSYSYDSRGKFLNGGDSVDAPETIVEGDVIGAYIVSINTCVIERVKGEIMSLII